MKTLDGWIFDVYPAGQEMAVWVLDAEGHAHCLRDHFAPAFFVGGTPKEQRAVACYLFDQHWNLTLSPAERTDLFLGKSIQVLQVQVNSPNLLPVIFERVTRLKPDLPYYNADISLPQMYFLERNVFPLAFCHFIVDDGKRILGLRVYDSPWEDDPCEMLETLRDLLVRHDPDLIVSDWGDSFILPRLMRLSRKHKIPLPFNRDPSRPPLFRPAESYFSYGRIVYKTAAQMLFGRWHIDRHNAFLTDDYGLEGVFEIARLTQIPVQRVVRTSTGTGMLTPI